MMVENPVQIAIYGASLFLTAVATLLVQDERYQPTFFAETTAVAAILHHNPTLLLYQADKPPADIPALLAAGLVLAEITPDKNQITIFRHQSSQHCVDVCDSTELQTKIIPFLTPTP
jgi:hypothetical protein